jgi:hypothetical protein
MGKNNENNYIFSVQRLLEAFIEPNYYYRLPRCWPSVRYCTCALTHLDI